MFFEANDNFSKILNNHWKCRNQKKLFSDNPGHNILELYNVLVQVLFATSKTEPDFYYNKFCIQVASGVAKQPKI